MNQIVCYKCKIDDHYFIYKYINANHYITQSSSKKILNIGTVIINQCILYKQYTLSDKLYIESIMSFINKNLMLNYHYYGLFNIIQNFLNFQITLKQYIDLELSLIRFSGYIIEYHECYICQKSNPEYLDISQWKGICANHKTNESIQNTFLSAQAETLILLNKFLILHNLLTEERKFLIKNIQYLIL